MARRKPVQSPQNPDAPEANAPEANAPEANAPEANAPEANAPEANAPEATSSVFLVCVRHNLTNPVTGAKYCTTPVQVDPALVEEGAESWENKQVTAGVIRVV